jgi:hypothetical protein
LHLTHGIAIFFLLNRKCSLTTGSTVPPYRISEAETRYSIIDPQLKKAGWNVGDRTQVGIEIPAYAKVADAQKLWRRSASAGRPISGYDTSSCNVLIIKKYLYT